MSANHSKATTHLSICGTCNSAFVQPVEAKRGDDGGVFLVLRCPECEVTVSGEFTWDQVNEFKTALTTERTELEQAYNEAVQFNMRDEISRFTNALERDLIGPDDFAPYRFTSAAKALEYQA